MTQGPDYLSLLWQAYGSPWGVLVRVHGGSPEGPDAPLRQAKQGLGAARARAMAEGSSELAEVKIMSSPFADGDLVLKRETVKGDRL